MLLKTILSRVQKHRGFVYGAVRLVEERRGLVIEAEIRPRAHRRPTCSGCAQPGPGYDTLARGASSSCRCGASRSSSSTRCGGWRAGPAASASKPSPG